MLVLLREALRTLQVHLGVSLLEPSLPAHFSSASYILA